MSFFPTNDPGQYIYMDFSKKTRVLITTRTRSSNFFITSEVIEEAKSYLNKEFEFFWKSEKDENKRAKILLVGCFQDDKNVSNVCELYCQTLIGVHAAEKFKELLGDAIELIQSKSTHWFGDGEGAMGVNFHFMEPIAILFSSDYYCDIREQHYTLAKKEIYWNDAGSRC